jgi:acetylornithine deacetylase/succinyl-diaminopimelate desuccinylase-like protein
VNIQFLWELEEEIGSPNFETTIKANAKDLTTDSVVVSDTVWVSRARPAAPAGLRGLQGLRFDLQTGETDQHSGTAGGAARNPISELAQLISECVDGRTGRVKIPGFYADVVPPTKRELEDLKNCGFTVKDFKRDHLFRSLRVDDPLEVMKRIWMMPTFEVHGIAGGYQGPGVKTIIPPKATAIVSCRLVPKMDPKKVVKLIRDFVKSKNPDVKVSAEHELPAYEGKTVGPYADAIRGSMKFAFGKEPVFVREGGSIGAVLSMERVLKAPVFFLGLSLPEHGYHAPNENFDWPQARGGMAAFADYFRRIGEMGKQTGRARG